MDKQKLIKLIANFDDIWGDLPQEIKEKNKRCYEKITELFYELIEED